MQRTDTHRPSAINPADYDFVAHQCVKIEGIGDCQFILAERKAFAEHQARTGGQFSNHSHGGNCDVCGSVNAVYNCIFYHRPSNSYISVGQDCTDNLFNSDFGAARFRKQVADVREYQAGRQKAQALLGDAGLSAAWDIFTADYEALPKTGARPERVVDGETIPAFAGSLYFEELTIRDIVGKLVKYGSISEKQTAFLGSLLAKIPARAAREAQFAAEREAAAPCPTGRVTITGTILKIEEYESQFGVCDKMTVKAEQGFIVWGTVPRSAGVSKGEKITFKATVTPSDRDPKFGFAKRPTIIAEQPQAWTPETARMQKGGTFGT